MLWFAACAVSSSSFELEHPNSARAAIATIIAPESRSTRVTRQRGSARATGDDFHKNRSLVVGILPEWPLCDLLTMAEFKISFESRGRTIASRRINLSERESVCEQKLFPNVASAMPSMIPDKRPVLLNLDQSFASTRGKFYYPRFAIPREFDGLLFAATAARFFLPL